MKANKRILLYGTSVILGSIVASLRHLPQFEVISLALPLRKSQTVDAARANILLFDLETTHSDAVLPLLGANPALQLIGINPGINLVQVWSIRELRELSMPDLVNLIYNGSESAPAGSGDDKNRHL